MSDKNSREDCAKEFLRATRKAVPKMVEEIEKRVKMGETEAESLTAFTNELIDIAKKTEKEVKDVPVSCFNCPLGNQHNGNPCTFSSPGLCKEVQNAICDLFEGKAQNWFGFRSKDVEMFEQEK
ncbi:MAG: hypothetical protein Q6366_002015 [Candidatus Freyarchaeota archaeon]|nr:hypothetical protein [Candidatus Jordarchaeia archaeon]MBS7269910.1 hypothetical protein [Candidatus Jordarchaeia archaeon]MBS7280605.1 hypothetical protein [Candidatus Jordarchaeia archaeon]